MAEKGKIIKLDEFRNLSSKLEDNTIQVKASGEDDRSSKDQVRV